MPSSDSKKSTGRSAVLPTACCSKSAQRHKCHHAGRIMLRACRVSPCYAVQKAPSALCFKQARPISRFSFFLSPTVRFGMETPPCAPLLRSSFFLIARENEAHFFARPMSSQHQAPSFVVLSTNLLYSNRPSRCCHHPSRFPGPFLLDFRHAEGLTTRLTPTVYCMHIFFEPQVTAFSALYMATNPWFFFYDPEKKEICPTT